MSEYQKDTDTPNDLQEPNNAEILKVLIYNEKLYAETNGKEFVSSWLSFPTTQEAVQEALREIGVDGKKYSRYAIDEKESDITGLADCILDHADLDELNYLAVKIRDMDERNLDILCAIIDKDSRSDNIAELINALDNFECYDLQPVFNAEMYGEFLINHTLEEIGTAISSLYEKNEAESYGRLMSRIEEIGNYVNTEKYGRQVVKLEKGSFTDFGYLTESDNKTALYRGKEDIPPEYKVFAYPDDEYSAGLYKIESADITDFVYKLHILPGDFTGDLASNMRMLAKGDADEYILVMNSHELRISRADETYRNDSEINEYLRDFPHDARAYLLSVESRDNNRANGTIVMVDCGALSADVDKNTISYTSVNACRPNGVEENYPRELWEAIVLENVDMTDWKIDFVFGDSPANALHRAEIFNNCLQEAKTIEPDTLLGYLNAEYMQKANYSQPGMIRIPLETAKTMLLNEDAPVYRLKPRSTEQLSIIAAATNAISTTHFCEFAIKREDKAGIDKACKRETEKLNNKPVEKDISKGRKTPLEEH